MSSVKECICEGTANMGLTCDGDRLLKNEVANSCLFRSGGYVVRCPNKNENSVSRTPC